MTIGQLRLSQTIVTPTLLPSIYLNTEVNDTYSTHLFTEITSTSTSFTIAILIGVIVVLFVIMTLGGVTCVSIMLILRRRKSSNTNNTMESRRSIPPVYYEI